MSSAVEHIQRTPLPVKLLYILLVLTFVVYIPISIFRINALLFVLDLCLMLALALTIINKKKMKALFAGRVSIFLLIILYIINLFFSFFQDFCSVDVNMLITVRNLLFGIGIFVITSIWLNTQKRVDMIINILLWGTFLTAVFGIRQLLFGFAPYEIDRLSMMGASLAEMETLNRIRITSSFGDPLLFAFFMMVGVFVYFISRSRKLSPIITRNIHPFCVLVILLALVLTLTRAPLVGLVCGAIMFSMINFKMTREYLVSYISILFFVITVAYGLYSLVTYQVFANSDNATLVAIDNASASFWSLFQMIMSSGEIDASMDFLVGQSKGARLILWDQGLSFLSSNPLGGGISNTAHYSFSLNDVGILSIGLRTGIIGLIVMIFLFLLIGVKAWMDIRRIPQLSVKRQGYLFLSIWIAIFVTNTISSLLDSSVCAIVIWIIAGILANQKKIYLSEIGQPMMVRSN